MKKILTLTFLIISFSIFAQQKLKVKVVNEKDPICGMNTTQFLTDTAIYQKKIYGFCSKSCKVEFIKNPKKYVKKK
ncbi:YHS domain-containing protein [Empedobacter falsenii]|uniref:YHS domain-containing protein n=1 Tax=Empedobacter falsenii TaxID=343874 RepID=UPI002578FE57|nr:YHS domain-containing protein [Empedobacter falsenii]MDM1063825.1 YHS domain-containing protein [Empedobacter falsenii]